MSNSFLGMSLPRQYLPGQLYFSLGIAIRSVLLIVVASRESVLLFPKNCSMVSFTNYGCY